MHLYNIPVPETPPANITFDNGNPYGVVVHWTPPAVSNGVITHYTLYIGYENGELDVFSLDRDTTSYNITNLNPYEQISINVTASTHVGEGPSSGNKIRTAQAGM